MFRQRLPAPHPVDDPLRACRRREDRAWIAAEYGEPIGDIAGMILSNLCTQTKRSACHRRGPFGDHFFHRVRFGTEARR